VDRGTRDPKARVGLFKKLFSLTLRSIYLCVKSTEQKETLEERYRSSKLLENLFEEINKKCH
jgi:hypothetical protein